MTGTGRRRTPVSIVCVFNDTDVRIGCLDRSIQALLATAPETEYLPVDNTTGRFPSAGAALNDGARRARHAVVVLVHQDVYLHSLVALEEAAAALQDDPSLGLLGAVGVTANGSVSGVVRDRVVLIGRPSDPTTPVDSLDEVLFLVERDRMLADPISEHPDLAWHAYAVEYGARVRSQGLRVATDHLPLTHNSMTTNLHRLAEAHHTVADLYPGLLPLHTTCGVVRASQARSRWRQAWRRRHGVATWWRESLAALEHARSSGGSVRDVVLGDIRLTVDDVLDDAGASALDVVNLVAAAPEPWQVSGLSRRGREVSATTASAADLDSLTTSLGRAEQGRALLVTGVDNASLVRLAPALRTVPHLVGLAEDTGAWVLCCPGAPDLRSAWPARRNAAFGWRRPASARAERAPVELAR